MNASSDILMNGEDRIASETVSAVTSFVSDLQSANGTTRRQAREALVALGRVGVPLLIPLLEEHDDDVRWEAAKALSEIGDPRSASGLVNVLMDHNFGIRWVAAEGLIAMGRPALIPLLQELAKNSDSTWLRRGAHHVIRGLAPQTPELKIILKDVLTALEGFEPEVGVIEPAYAALDRLRVETF